MSGLAAVVSIPAEVTVVRMSNDATLPLEQRRNYKNLTDAFSRIAKEEGLPAFFRGLGPYANRAMLVISWESVFPAAGRIGDMTVGTSMYLTINPHVIKSFMWPSIVTLVATVSTS